MATFTKRNGRWRAQIRKKDYNKAATFATKREAQQWASKLEAEYDYGRAGRMGEVKTLGDALERYQLEVAKGSPSERWQYNKVRHLSEFSIYNVYLKELTATHLSEFRDLRLSQIKPGTVIKELGYLSGVLTQCVKEWRWIGHNPMADVRYPKPPLSGSWAAPFRWWRWSPGSSTGTHPRPTKSPAPGWIGPFPGR